MRAAGIDHGEPQRVQVRVDVHRAEVAAVDRADGVVGLAAADRVIGGRQRHAELRAEGRRLADNPGARVSVVSTRLCARPHVGLVANQQAPSLVERELEQAGRAAAARVGRALAQATDLELELPHRQLRRARQRGRYGATGSNPSSAAPVTPARPMSVMAQPTVVASQWHRSSLSASCGLRFSPAATAAKLMTMGRCKLEQAANRDPLAAWP